jgi:hypothetical protein
MSSSLRTKSLASSGSALWYTLTHTVCGIVNRARLFANCCKTPHSATKHIPYVPGNIHLTGRVKL